MKENKIEITIRELQKEELTEIELRLLQKALKATEHAYAPYSNFHVGAAVLMDNGKIITGSNQENEAYPSGLCAERVTLFSANHLFPDNKIKALAITATFKNNQVEQITPCGACRQVILESERRQNSPICIYLWNSHKILKIEKATDLLPLAFNM